MGATRVRPALDRVPHTRRARSARARAARARGYGREEYHVQPAGEHGHRYCERCGRHWDIEPGTAAGTAMVAAFASEGFTVDLSHMTVVGHCESCD